MSSPYGQQPPYGYGQPQMPMPNQYGQPYVPGYQYGQQPYQPQPAYQQPPPENKPTKIDVNNGNGDFKKSKIEFNEKPKYQDLWATFVYLATLAVTIAVAVWSIPSMPENIKKLNQNVSVNNNGKTYSSSSSSSYKYGHYKRDNKDINVINVAIIIGSSFIVSAIVTSIYFTLVQKFTGKMIKGTFILSIILNIIYACISVLINPILGLVMLLFAGLYVLCYFFWRSRIPFAKVVLKTVTSVTKKYPATIFLGVIECIIASIWYVFVCFTLVAAIAKSVNEKNENSKTIAYVVYVFLIFSFFFTSQVINNFVHVTISGVFATYYFRGVHEPGTNKIEVDVKNPTLKSFKRAATTSFGSICFGSLLIALVSTLRVLANQTKQEAAEDENYILCLIACCVECILSCIEDGIEYFNVYAFTEVAIYGKPYCQAAKDTWTLCKSRGIEAIINDNIIGNVLSIGALAIGSLTALVTCFAAKFFGVGLEDEKIKLAVMIIFGLIGFLIGCMTFSVVAQVINSGVATTFVCLCEDPDALRQTKPELWEKVRDTYPSMVY